MNKLFIKIIHNNYSLSSIHHWDETELLTGHGNKISFQRDDIKIPMCWCNYAVTVKTLLFCSKICHGHCCKIDILHG